VEKLAGLVIDVAMVQTGDGQAGHGLVLMLLFATVRVY
jgi:hypothetical protein